MSSTNREERLEEALVRIAQWSDAYPLSVFPEPDQAYYKHAHEVLTAHGMTLDRLSAAAMRHVVLAIGKIAKEALTDESTSLQDQPSATQDVGHKTTACPLCGEAQHGRPCGDMECPRRAIPMEARRR